MLKEDQSSYGTYSSSNSKQSQDFSSDSSKFYLKCGIFACITITALILMAMYHSQSTVSSATNDNNIISPLHAMTRSDPEDIDLIPYRVNFHICDEEGAGHDPLDQEPKTYYVKLESGRGHMSDPQAINVDLIPDTYIGLTYNLPSALGRDIKSITFIANNNDPICIDSITITVDPFKSDGRGSVERVWVTTEYQFEVDNTCDIGQDDAILSPTLKDRNLYFVGLGIKNKALEAGQLESQAIGVQLGGDNGLYSDTFLIKLDDGYLDPLNSDRYYIRQYESKIDLGSKIKEVKVFSENVEIDQIIAASAANPGAVTIGHNNGDREESWMVMCYGDENDDEEKMEYMEAHASELQTVSDKSQSHKKPMPKNREIADSKRGKNKGATVKINGKVGAKGKKTSDNDL
mmetsp:Transcript_47632/g.42717  ORF Transcript_47632/g.42717 Transcript_47632/m.42717 type:complete len:404 (+) Transcript_47632:48-1259(+)